MDVVAKNSAMVKLKTSGSKMQMCQIYVIYSAPLVALYHLHSPIPPRRPAARSANQRDEDTPRRLRHRGRLFVLMR